MDNAEIIARCVDLSIPLLGGIMGIVVSKKYVGRTVKIGSFDLEISEGLKKVGYLLVGLPFCAYWQNVSANNLLLYYLHSLDFRPQLTVGTFYTVHFLRNRLIL